MLPYGRLPLCPHYRLVWQTLSKWHQGKLQTPSPQMQPSVQVTAREVPRQTSGYRREYRPECCTLPPRCKPSSQSHYSGPRNLKNTGQKGKHQSWRDRSGTWKRAFSHLLLCCSSMRCSALSRSLYHDAWPQQTDRRCSRLCGQSDLSLCSSMVWCSEPGQRPHGRRFSPCGSGPTICHREELALKTITRIFASDTETTTEQRG